MFDNANHTKDVSSALEERRLLQQVISLGVGYPYGRQGFSKAATTDTQLLYRQISISRKPCKDLDIGGITQKAHGHIRNGDEGYYLLDLHKGRLLAKGQHPIKDIIIDFTLPGADDRFLLRKRKGTCFHETGFLIVPDAVYFLGINSICIPLNEFHMLSVISSDDESKFAFVADYDATQNNRPLVLFPCEENNDIIQDQLNHDDYCREAEYESLIGNIGSYWENI